MDTKLVGLIGVIIILLIVAAIGFYEYSLEAGNYSSLSSSYSSLSSSYSTLNSSLSAQLQKAKQNESMYMKEAENYSDLYMMYKSLYKQNTEGAALDTALEFYDGISIESPSDVLPYLASNFTATIKGVPFSGTYNLESFNNTWLSDFFSNYETVYFYTTALPTITQLSPNTYEVTDVVQFFVAPSNDPIYLQVFNASNTIIVQEINGKMEITSLTWSGNEVPPSTVISGYPSQHILQSNVALSEVLSEINGLGGEFSSPTIAQNFAPNAVLEVTGQLPSVFKPGNYSGISNIESFFSTWDNYFIFVAEYSQNLLPNGTAVPPSVSVELSPSGTMAMVVANVTPFIGFVNQGEPGFPNIYDIHVDLVTYLQYNSTTASWQIEKQIFNATMIPILQDTLYYNLNMPIFKVIGEDTVTVNASQGAILQEGNIVTVIKPGTYAMLPNKSIVSVYNFSLVTFSLQAVMPPAQDFFNLTPTYAFAFAINGQISPEYSLVNASGSPDAAITIVYAPDTWTSWTWFGGTFNGTAYMGGSYKFADHWIYGNGVIVNNQFFKPVLWIFESSCKPVGMPPTPVSITPKEVLGLSPIADYTYEVNGETGGVVTAGNILVVVQPGTTITAPSGNLTTFNFSIVFYAPQNVTAPKSGQVPFLVFAYAINNCVSFHYVASKPFITVIMTPSCGANMWTWGLTKSGTYGYVLHDPILIGHGIVINLTFVRPVPWVLTLPLLM
ncbi:hypothetical protein [Acidianus sp. HS-5]|uniref:hypothetical protein n=1 Tax=Acidianus sp. HS-5 TaxID=2886040 RepID=UPI001F3B2763|nr:hypothetical protein [Acidianus sp. HS-5]BDC19694.1 hypothetical protein HS5_25840 [Acidianus sp. HS-5]